MLAAYRNGHGAEAQEAYQRYVEALDDETGASPDSTTRALHYAMSRNDDTVVDEHFVALSLRRVRVQGVTPRVPRELPPDR